MVILNKIKNLLILIFGKINNSRDSRSIFYHDLHSVNYFTSMSTNIDLFEKHIEVINNLGFEIVPEITKSKGQIEISFDDGFRGVYENINFFNKLQVPLTIFVITSKIGMDNYLNEMELKKLSENNLINIQSHSHNHLNLSLLDDNQILNELIKSKEILEQILQKEIFSLCFPRGFFTDNIVRIGLELKYTKQYSSIPGKYYNEVLPSVKRRSLVQFSTQNEIKNILMGGDDILNFWYKNKHIS